MVGAVSTAAHALEAERLGKVYRSFPSRLTRALFALGWPAARRPGRAREHWALRDVSFRLPRGGALGLVGANGAGKSTLLRVLSGSSALSEGRFRSFGRLASLIELGTGFHPDFSGRENVVLNGILLGCTRAEMRRRLGEILEFSELGNAVDEPVRTYSTGMAMRLGFAAALGVEPEVLLLDEVFAVGDLYFQKKCVDRLFEFRHRGGSLILCSHSLYDLRQMCDQALWLRAGRVAAAGDATSVTQSYASWQRERIDLGLQRRAGRGERDGTGQRGPRIVAAELIDARGEPVECVRSGGSVRLLVHWENPLGEPIHVGVTLTRQDMTLASGLATHLDGFELQGRTGCVELELPCLELLAGTFTLVVILFDRWGVHRHQEHVLDRPLVVTNDSKEVGLVRLAHRWSASEAAPRVLPARAAPSGAGEAA